MGVRGEGAGTGGGAGREGGEGDEVVRRGRGGVNGVVEVRVGVGVVGGGVGLGLLGRRLDGAGLGGGAEVRVGESIGYGAEFWER